MTRTQRRLALWQAFVTFYLTLASGAALSEIIGGKVAGLLALIGAALNAATVVFLSLTGPRPVANDRAGAV